MDTLTREQRSQRMSLVRNKNTKPEMVVRRLAHSLGYRYRLHVKKLPGAPDLVFPRLRKIINVHGCFWHQHSCVMGDRMPKSRVDFWQGKLKGNVARDRRARAKLRRQGWDVLTLWECQLRDQRRLAARIRRFLDSTGGPKQEAPDDAGAGVDVPSTCVSET